DSDAPCHSQDSTKCLSAGHPLIPSPPARGDYTPPALRRRLRMRKGGMRLLPPAAPARPALSSSREGSKAHTGQPVVPVAQPGVLRAIRKPTVPIQFEFPGAVRALVGPNLNGSMKARRDAAWATMKRIWKPVQVEGGVIPLWMTWYERQDLEDL